MTTFVEPDAVAAALAIAEQETITGCGCHFADDVLDQCAWHRVAGLLHPTVTAHEPVF